MQSTSTPPVSPSWTSAFGLPRRPQAPSLLTRLIIIIIAWVMIAFALVEHHHHHLLRLSHELEDILIKKVGWKSLESVSKVSPHFSIGFAGITGQVFWGTLYEQVFLRLTFSHIHSLLKREGFQLSSFIHHRNS